jgi:hypothetical protein
MSGQGLFLSLVCWLEPNTTFHVKPTHSAWCKSSSFIFFKVGWEIKDTEVVIWAPDPKGCNPS